MPAGDNRNGGTRNEISLIVDYEDADELCSDYTENLSSGGAFIHTERQLEVGNRVELQLSFPGLVAPIALQGVVRWVRNVGPNDNGVGIEFVDFDDDLKARLDSLIESIWRKDPKLVRPVLRILLVEDNPHVAKLVQNGLETERFSESEFDIVCADNGRKALDLLASSSFDLAVLDVNLPIMDGPSVIREIRKDARLKSLPIIAISAGGQEAANEAMSAGADCFLEKPMRLRQIIETMAKLLRVPVGG